VTPEDSVRIGALLAGQADFIRQVQAYDEKQATDQGFKVYAAPTRGVNDSLSFRPDNPLVADLRVRQALLHATNAKQVVETLFSANYPQATSVLASSAAGYVNLSDKLTFDQAKARQLLDEAGWKAAADGIRSKDGQRLALTVYESLPQPQNKEVLQLIAQQWRQVGVALSGQSRGCRQPYAGQPRPAENPAHRFGSGPRRPGRGEKHVLPQQPRRAAAERRLQR
jgi:peptide/nickel transport system substrate-binding protein